MAGIDRLGACSHVPREHDVPTMRAPSAGHRGGTSRQRQRAARLPARLHLRGERGDLRIREVELGARLLRSLGGERLDPTIHHALAIGRRRGEHVGGRFRGAGERLDAHDLRAEVLESGASVEVAVLGFLGYPVRVLRCVCIYLESDIT